MKGSGVWSGQVGAGREWAGFRQKVGITGVWLGCHFCACVDFPFRLTS